MTYCCDAFKAQIEYSCPQHDAEGVRCPDAVLFRGESSGRLFLASPNATYTFQFCPWCGTKVQDELEDEDETESVTYEGPVEIGGHLFLFMPATGDFDNESPNRWVSCVTCETKLAMNADPKKVVEEHLAGERKGVDPYAPRVLGVTECSVCEGEGRYVGETGNFSTETVDPCDECEGRGRVPVAL